MPPVVLLPALATIAMALFAFSRPTAGASDTPRVLIDFSHAGYGGGGTAVPTPPAVLRVSPSGGDDTALIQRALDAVADLPLQSDGFRGALLLMPGRYQINGQLRLADSGVVLRGSGSERTTLVAAGRSRRTLVEVGGDAPPATDEPVTVVDKVVPAGARTLMLEHVKGLSPGDRVVITRPSPQEWIESLGMDEFEGAFADLRLDWRPGTRNLVWDRIITAVDPQQKRITVDAPISTALEQRFGGGTVAKVTDRVPPRNIGIEHLSLESEYDTSRPHDEEHAWIAIALDHIEDAWVRDVVVRQFVSSAVRVGTRGRRISVADVHSKAPVSEPGGYRRQSFLVHGQQVLVSNCTAEAAMNAFAVGLLAGGPNVFLNCVATGALGPVGAFESWSSGTLYENVRVEGAPIWITRDSTRSAGGGWTAANSVIWNSQAEAIEAEAPEGAENAVITSDQPLYETQLAQRIGAGPEPATRPAASPNDIPTFDREGVATASAAPSAEHPPLEIINGRFVIDGRTLWGGMANDAWWLGNTNPAAALDAGFSITRFVPGQVGPGLTEDLSDLAQRLAAAQMPFYNAGPGLWYDRRRDDHTIDRREDANVWAAFYEMPWLRSGEGTAWDGLSKYDLTQYNPWYFDRHRQFAQLAEQHGLVYFHSLYNTHNLLETAAHWVDYPWRPANNINDTGLPEPPPLEPRNTIHIADQFYNVDHPGRRALHRAYIFHVLDQLADTDNTIFGLGFQFSGPLAFQQFFQDTVAEWEEKNNRRVRILLATSKEITDAILNDPVRSKQVAVVDMRYWQYRPDGELWAPAGEGKRAFREMIGAEFGRSTDAPPPTTPQQLYRQVREYHDRFPDKALVAWNGGVGPIPILMAGGAQALMRNPTAGHGQGRHVDHTPLDSFVQEHLAPVLMGMTPRDELFTDGENTWALADDQATHVLIYSLIGPTITPARDLPDREYRGIWFNPRSGAAQPMRQAISGKAGTPIDKPSDEDWLLLLQG